MRGSPRFRMPALASRDRRALRWGMMLLAPAFAYGLVVKPYVAALRESRERLTTERDLLRRELELLANAHGFVGQASRAEHLRGREASRLFPGPDDLLATAALAFYVTNSAQNAEVVVQQIESRTPEPSENGLVMLNVSLRAEGDLEGMLRLLHGLETGPKLVRVERVQVERGSQPYGTAAGAEVLTMSADLRGYTTVRADTSETTAPPRVSSKGSD